MEGIPPRNQTAEGSVSHAPSRHSRVGACEYRRNTSRKVLSPTAVLLGLLLVLGMASAARATTLTASSVSQQTVDFGLPRTQVVSGLDLEAACQVVATYEGLVILDGQSAGAFISVDPGQCAITVYVLGVALSLPILDETPLGRYHFDIVGVTIANFGIADVSVDLLTSLAANYAGSSPVISPEPVALSWTQWGTSALTVAADSGSSGDSLFLSAPYAVSMTFGVGASVQALGLTVWSANLATLGAVAGTPSLSIPVTVDLRPSTVAVSGGWAPSPYSLQVNWTPNTDSDFAGYRIAVQDNGSPPVVYSDVSQASSSITVPAEAGQTYTVTVVAVDQAGLASAQSTVSISTPLLSSVPAVVSGAAAPDATLVAVVFTLAVGVAAFLGYLAGRRRSRR